MEDVNTGSKEIDEIDEALRTRPRASAIGFSQSAIRLDWAAPFHPLHAEVYERTRNEIEDRLTDDVGAGPYDDFVSRSCSSARAPPIEPSKTCIDQFEIKDGNRLRNSGSLVSIPAGLTKSIRKSIY
jgi:hypothetical protein